MIMKWWCLFLIKDDAGKDIVDEYFRRLKLLTVSTSWKVRSAAEHLLPLMPHEEIHLAILPLLQSTCQELEVSWKSSKLRSYESDLQSWLENVARLKDTYNFPSQPSPTEGASTARRMEQLLDQLPVPGTYTLEVIIDRDLFVGLNVESNVLLYGALFRAYMWHHGAIRPMGGSSNSEQLNCWLDNLGVIGQPLQTAWLPVWKGHVSIGSTTSLYHFELQCCVPAFELTALNSISEEKIINEEDTIWNSHLEVLEEFTFGTLPMHLILPLAFRLSSTSNLQTMALLLQDYRGTEEERCMTVRLSYWYGAELKTKPSKPSTSDWQDSLLGEMPLQPASVGDQCLQRASGHLHFILFTNGITTFLFPLRKTPAPVQEMCHYAGRQSATSLPIVESAAYELLQDIPLVSTNSILDSVRRNNSLRLAALKKFIASGECSSIAVQELEKAFNNMAVEESDWVIDASAKPSVVPSDYVTNVSLGDPSDWPERCSLLLESLKSASEESRTMSAACGPDRKVLSISAAEIIKLFDESGRAKRKPLHPVYPVGQSTKPSVSWDQLESTNWPDVLQCKYHDLYYNTDSEALESSCCAMREQCLVDETAATCSSSLESSALPQSKSRIPSSKASVPVRMSPMECSPSGDRTTQRSQQEKHSLTSRNGHAAPALRRSPRKASLARNHPLKTTPLVRSSSQAAASPFMLRRSPRKIATKHGYDDSRKETAGTTGGTASATGAENLRLKLRVAVANALEKNGVCHSSSLYKPCGKKLFAICSAFAKDLVGSGRTSELLQKIADSHAKQVIKFEMLMPGCHKSETTGASS